MANHFEYFINNLSSQDRPEDHRIVLFVFDQCRILCLIIIYRLLYPRFFLFLSLSETF